MENASGFVMAIHVEQWEYWHVPDMYNTVAMCHACPGSVLQVSMCQECAEGYITAGHMPCWMAHAKVLICVYYKEKLMLGDVSDVPEIKVEVLCTCIVLQAAI